jgi:hypothetical protein
LGVNLDTSKGRSQESGEKKKRRKKKEERRKFFYSLFSDNSIEFNFVLYGFYQQPVVGLN